VEFDLFQKEEGFLQRSETAQSLTPIGGPTGGLGPPGGRRFDPDGAKAHQPTEEITERIGKTRRVGLGLGSRTTVRLSEAARSLTRTARRGPAGGVQGDSEASDSIITQ
jgi:hypothetical protein